MKKTPKEGERHHIIPKCIGGTDEEENIIFIGYREHYLCHYILTKVFNSSKLLFAFTNMQRVCEGKSILYPFVRKRIGEAISKMNKGLKRSEGVKRECSERYKNTIIAKRADGSGPNFRVSVQDPRYLSGELVFYRKGSKHKESTKNKMSKNGLSGRAAHHRGHEIRYFYPGEDTFGFTKGLPPDNIERQLLNLRKPRKLKTRICPHCGLQGSGGNMTRSHFDNCKHKNEI